MLSDDKLDFWFEHNQNVLFVGKRGCGKTSAINACFERHGLVMNDTYLYFSSSTMDPWVDFVGVPKEHTEDVIPDELNIIKELASINQDLACTWVASNWKLDSENCNKVVQHALSRRAGLTYLDLVRPKSLITSQVQAMVFDEFSRSVSKIRNAVMELLQFKSINGKKFPNLKVIWAAINPGGGEDNYDVEKLDDAQIDRFHVKVEVPYKPSLTWFSNKYGENLAKGAVAWWSELPEEEKNKISPRRLEYALDLWKVGGDLLDILPASCNCKKLTENLMKGPIKDRLTVLLTKNSEEIKDFFSVDNNYYAALPHIIETTSYLRSFTHFFPKEKLAVLLTNPAKKGKALRHICQEYHNRSVFKEVIDEIIRARQNTSLVDRLKKEIDKHSVKILPTKLPDLYDELSSTIKPINIPPINPYTPSNTIARNNREAVENCLDSSKYKSVQDLCREAGVSINGIKPYLDHLVNIGKAITCPVSTTTRYRKV